jgi:hypothetical protein
MRYIVVTPAAFPQETIISLRVIHIATHALPLPFHSCNTHTALINVNYFMSAAMQNRKARPNQWWNLAIVVDAKDDEMRLLMS